MQSLDYPSSTTDVRVPHAPSLAQVMRITELVIAGIPMDMKMDMYASDVNKISITMSL